MFRADWDVRGLAEPTVRGVFKAFCKLFPPAEEVEGRTTPLKGRPPIVRGLQIKNANYLLSNIFK